MTLSLRDAMQAIDDHREKEAAAEATYWQGRRKERLLRTRLEAKLDQRSIVQPRPTTPTPIRQPHRAVTAGSSGVETKERHEPVAVPGSRWVRQNDDHWVRVQ